MLLSYQSQTFWYTLYLKVHAQSHNFDINVNPKRKHCRTEIPLKPQGNEINKIPIMMISNPNLHSKPESLLGHTVASRNALVFVLLLRNSGQRIVKKVKAPAAVLTSEALGKCQGRNRNEPQ